ncbi:acyl-CoA thioesterase [Lignipirellula cremea]|uniref:Putative acyl-CoA thioester hydrolase n=1 Tax=Lignipirellula cremea TaxID=2528010 RepID=A0A518DSZ2_9BACT|nr:hotdog domain-containing protein [Lignipirellula cremea]QDU94944.1 putative acyl-CoA thioester hydrolase [Lignipirellula cremea]
MTEQAETERYLALQAVMMPRDTNVHGTIFGGVLLSYIDQAGAVGARRAIQMRGSSVDAVVTVAMNGVEFHQPVFVGDVVAFYSQVTKIGRTSITVDVVVEADRNQEPVLLTQAKVVYVAVKLVDGSPIPIPIFDEA